MFTCASLFLFLSLHRLRMLFPRSGRYSVSCCHLFLKTRFNQRLVTFQPYGRLLKHALKHEEIYLYRRNKFVPVCVHTQLSRSLQDNSRMVSIKAGPFPRRIFRHNLTAKTPIHHLYQPSRTPSSLQSSTYSIIPTTPRNHETIIHSPQPPPRHRILPTQPSNPHQSHRSNAILLQALRTPKTKRKPSTIPTLPLSLSPSKNTTHKLTLYSTARLQLPIRPIQRRRVLQLRLLPIHRPGQV